MEQGLFSITCTTCRARLRVRSQQAIGQILECPKCGSMVQVIPPGGWQAEADGARQSAGAGTATGQAMGTVPSGAASGMPAGTEAGSPGPPGVGVSPTEMAWRRWLWFAAGPAAGLVVMVGVCSILFWRGGPQTPPSPAARQPMKPAPTDDAVAAKPQPEPSPRPFDRRWLPDGTKLLFDLQPLRLAGRPGWDRLVAQFDGLWRQTGGPVLETLGLKLGAIRRVSWASTDLAAWPDHSVVIIDLEPGQHGEALGAIGEAVDLEWGGATCRRLPRGPWKHPFAVVGRGTVVTGEVELLRHLAGRSEPGLESPPLERLLELAAPDAELTLLVDLLAARKASCKLPTALLDVWPAGKKSWRAIWDISEGLGCRLRGTAPLRSELILVCEGRTAAEKVGAAVSQLVPAAGTWLSGESEALPGRFQAGQMTSEAAGRYKLLLADALAASKVARWKVADAAVWVWVDWRRGPSVLAAAAESRPVIRAVWLAAAREADQANHLRLLGGLGAYQAGEGRFPPAVLGGARLSPEERLSWIVELLPYYGHADWHCQLARRDRWNSPRNRTITQRPLPEIVNPALGPGRTEAGFPVTHYVGVAGVGPDAGRLKADHPRAGLFGYERRTGPEDLADGAAHTVAVLGVTKRLGAWAAGGQPTVRALTEPPYVNGPDGFGSGQPDGMLAGMADGSVRFISKDVDPRVLEQLATIHGDRGTTAVAAGPRPQRPQPKPKPRQPRPDPPQPGPDGPGGHPTGPGPDLPPDAPDKPEEPDEPDKPDEQPAPTQLDVEARLAETIPEVELHMVPLAEAVDLLAGLSGVPMTFDPQAMRQIGVGLRDPVTVELSGATVGQVLEGVLAGRGLAAVAENGQILLTSPADHRERLFRRPYTVSDLTGRQPAAVGELAALVEKLVAPDSWRSAGGRGSIKPDAGTLVVVQTGLVHHQVLTFCEKVRRARGKPLRSRYDPDRFTLKTRRAQARQVLLRPVTANFHEPTRLIEILAYLGRLAETDILVDRPALAAAGLSAKTDASVTIQKQPLASALDELLRPLGLRYRAIDANTLQVATPKAIAARLELEFHPVGESLTGGRTGPALVEQIKGRLAASTWSDAGGPGVLHLDRPSGYLIVLQSQPVQAALERLLAELRN